MIIFLEILFITSVLPFGNLMKDRSLTYLSENSSNPIEEIANTRLVILNSGKRAHLNLYFLSAWWIIKKYFKFAILKISFCDFIINIRKIIFTTDRCQLCFF